MAVLDDLLDRARRRHYANLGLQAVALALLVGCCGLLVLLLLGTQVLDWYWPVLLGLAALAIAIVRSRKEALSPYRLAQLVDRKLELNDRLSTVFYYRHLRNQGVEGLEIVEKQAAASVSAGDALRAIPIVWPRATYPAVAVLLMCAGALALRYGLLNTLDLSRPVAGTSWSPFETSAGVQAAGHKSVIQEHLEKQLQQIGLSVGENPMQPLNPDQQQNTESSVPTPDGISLAADKSQGTGDKGPEGGELGEQSDQGSGESSSEQGNDDPSGGQSNPKSPQSPKQDAKNSKGQKGSENTLPNRLRDAIANLMSKLKPESSEGKGEGQQQDGQSQGAERQQQAKNGTQSQGKNQSEGQSSPESQDAQQGSADQSPGAQSKSAEKSGDKPGGQDAKSGMGKQDGEKAIRDAEQLAAMGKISEIFGKRAQQIQGQVTVEVPPGKQQLRTEYSQQQTRSTGYAGEGNRDEIPLMYQTYVQRYFEEIRKAPPVKGKAPAAAKPAGASTAPAAATNAPAAPAPKRPAGSIPVIDPRTSATP